MLPRKRAGEGEAVNVSDSKSIKRQHVVSSTEDSNTQVKNSSATSSDGVGNNNCSGNSNEPTVTDMAFDNGTPREIVVGRCFCEGGMQKQGPDIPSVLLRKSVQQQMLCVALGFSQPLMH